MSNADGSITVKLKKPVKHGDQEVAVLTVREPVAKDLRKLPQALNTGDLLNLAGALTGQPPSVIDQLCMADTQKVLGIVGNFMEGGQATGETDSEL